MSDLKAKMAERLKKLADLQKKGEEGRQANHHEMRLETARHKLPKNWESRKERAEKYLFYDKLQDVAKEKGVDYDRLVTRNVTAVDAEKWERRHARKHKNNSGENDYCDFEAAAVRKHQKLIENMPAPDLASYAKRKETMDEKAFLGDLSVPLYNLHKDRPEAIDRLVRDVNEQVAKRAKFSRRRTYNADADVDFINERNSKFNKKLERYYGEFTTEIKQNIERGTNV